MVFVRDFLITRPAIAEIMAFDNAILFEQLDGAIDRGKRDILIDRIRAAMQFFSVRVVVCQRQGAGNDLALLGHAKAFFGAEFFQTVHDRSCSPLRCGLSSHWLGHQDGIHAVSFKAFIVFRAQAIGFEAQFAIKFAGAGIIGSDFQQPVADATALKI